MTDDELREFFEQNMAELSPKLHDLREELARVSELLDEARATDTLDPRFAGVSNLVVGLMDVDIRTLQLVDVSCVTRRVTNDRTPPPPSGVVHVPVALATTVLSTEIVNTQGPVLSLGFTFTSSTTCSASPACHTWMVRTAL